MPGFSGYDRVDALHPTPRLRPNGPIVRAAELALWGDARDALAAARRHGDEARVAAAEALEAARCRGHAEGRAAGAEEAARLVAETATRATEHLAALERDLPALIHGIVARILGEFDAGDLIVRAVRGAVAAMRPGAEATLRVASADAVAVAAALADLQGSVDCASIRVEADPALHPGEACLRGVLGDVELGVAAQLRALRAALGGGAFKHPAAGDVA